jgi:NAD(P)-dependent dehydrogenase (short-subunit alcohol dehydrogenase family)
MNMAGQLEGKVAIITGAGSGIGRAASIIFAREGARLIIGDRSASVNDTAADISKSGGQVTALQIDAGLESDVMKLVATAYASYGQLDVAFANAGVSGGRDGIFDLTPEAWTEILRINRTMVDGEACRQGHGRCGTRRFDHLYSIGRGHSLWRRWPSLFGFQGWCD